MPRGAAPRRSWTAQEDSFLEASHKKLSLTELGERLGRTKMSVAKRCVVLGIGTRQRWTREEDHRLGFLWITTMPILAMSRRLKRSPQSICRRAKKLGLPSTMPDGYEFVTASARRTGFTTPTLLRILQWAEVPLHLARNHYAGSRPSTARVRGPYHQRYVDPFDVDEAIERWHLTAPVEEIAHHHGLDGTTLRKRLAREGRLPRSESGKRTDLRVHEASVLDVIEQLKKEREERIRKGDGRSRQR